MAESNKQALRIVIALPHLKAGGAERTAAELANYLVSRGDKVTLLLMYREPIFFDLQPGINVVQPAFRRSPFGKYVHTFHVIIFLRRALKSLRPDVVFSIGYMALTLVASLGLPLKVVLSGRSSPDRVRFPHSPIANGLYNLSHRLLRPRVNGIIAQTQRATAKYMERYQCPIITIPNFLRNLSDIHQVKMDQVVTVGRCSKEKGHHFLLQAFAKVKAPGWKLVVVGDGPERETLTQLAARLSIGDRVIFAGFQKDVDQYLAASRIFAFPSLHEGFPNALLEAMATPLACVSFDCVAGPADLIRDGENGFLVKVGDIDQLAARLQQLIDDSALRNRLATKAGELRAAHRLDVIAGQYRNFFKHLSTIPA